MVIRDSRPIYCTRLIDIRFSTKLLWKFTCSCMIWSWFTPFVRIIFIWTCAWKPTLSSSSPFSTSIGLDLRLVISIAGYDFRTQDLSSSQTTIRTFWPAAYQKHALLNSPMKSWPLRRGWMATSICLWRWCADAAKNDLRDSNTNKSMNSSNL